MTEFIVRSGSLHGIDLPSGDAKASAAKWEFIRDHDDEIIDDGGPRTCSLCLEYFDYACRGCPVSAKTKQPFCLGTPIEEWHELPKGNSRTNVAEEARVFLMSLEEQNGANSDS